MDRGIQVDPAIKGKIDALRESSPKIQKRALNPGEQKYFNGNQIGLRD